MITAFRQLIAEAMASKEDLESRLHRLTPDEWQGVSDLLAVRLPEFDGVYSVPGAEVLGTALAQARGVPHLQHWTDHSPGEAIILTPYLQDGQVEEAACRAGQDAGWQVTHVVAAAERTTQGARARLTELGLTVRAAVQVADTPTGLVFERRSPERWMMPDIQG